VRPGNAIQQAPHAAGLRTHGSRPPVLQSQTLLTAPAGAFEDVGSTGALSAYPSAAHFGGFTVGALHSLSVRLTTTSPAAALRVHVVPPESPFFKVSHRRCGGAILPGLSDVLVVEFCPTELRYYHDIIRVHSNVGGRRSGWGLGRRRLALAATAAI
jgi:hypothetical protein